MNELLYEYLVTLKIGSREYEKFCGSPLTTSIFTLPNQGAFQFITHFLFSKLDRAACTEKFRQLWPPLSKKHVSDFNKVAFNWLSNLAQENPDARIPRVSMMLFISPYGERLCSLYVAFARFILIKTLKQKNKVRILNYPNPTPETKTLTLNAHLAMCQKLDLQHDEIQKGLKDVHAKLEDCASVLIKTNTELKCNIKETESLLEERNKEILSVFGDDNMEEAERKLADWNAAHLNCLRSCWQEMESLHRTIIPLKKILNSDFLSLDKLEINGDLYSVRMPPTLIQEIRPKLEQENLFKIQENGKLNFEKLVKFFAIVLSTFDTPLKELAKVFSVNRIRTEHKLLEEEVEKALEKLNRVKNKIASFHSFLQEHKGQLGCFDEPKACTINGRSYSLQQTTPQPDSTSGIGSTLDDSSCTNLMNLSPVVWLNSSDSDNLSSPDLRPGPQRFLRRYSAKGMTDSFSSPVTHDKEKSAKLEKDRSKGFFKKTARRSWSNSAVFNKSEANSVFPPTKGFSNEDNNNQPTLSTPTENKSFFWERGTAFVDLEDAIRSPSLNNSYAANDTLNLSLLDAQTLPECPEFDITTELEASHLLLELSN